MLSFISGLLQYDPAQRWTPRQAIQHPFITGSKYTGRFAVAPAAPAAPAAPPPPAAAARALGGAEGEASRVPVDPQPLRHAQRQTVPVAIGAAAAPMPPAMAAAAGGAKPQPQPPPPQPQPQPQPGEAGRASLTESASITETEASADAAVNAAANSNTTVAPAAPPAPDTVPGGDSVQEEGGSGDHGLAKGEPAVLSGILARPELNGTRVVVGQRHAGGKYEVAVGGEELIVEAANVSRNVEWSTKELALAHKGRRVSVFWEGEETWYDGWIDQVGGTLRPFVKWNDGSQGKWYIMPRETYRWLEGAGSPSSDAGPSGVVKQEVEGEGGRRRSGRVTNMELAASIETAARTNPPDIASKLNTLELHCGTAGLSRALYVNHGCNVTMIDLKDLIEWDEQFSQDRGGVTFMPKDIDQLCNEVEFVAGLLRGTDILWVAPTCTRMSNQTAGEEQRFEPRPTGHAGEGLTPQGKASDEHVKNVLWFLRTAKAVSPCIKIAMENPADAGMEQLDFVKQVARQLGLTKVYVNYCAWSDQYSWKKTVIYTNSESMIAQFGDGQRLCKHPPTFKHVECSKNSVEAAAYPPRCAKEWAALLVKDAKKARAEVQAAMGQSVDLTSPGRKRSRPEHDNEPKGPPVKVELAE